MMNESAVAAAAALAQLPRIETVNDVPVLLCPDNFTHISLGNMLSNPSRKSGRVTLADVASFIDVAKRQGSLSKSLIYLDVDFAKQHFEATAVFNEHDDGDGKAGWRDHRATFVPKFTEEWRRWIGLNTKEVNQVALGNFLETNLADIVSPTNSGLPTGSDVLTFVTALSETRKVKYGNATNLQNGMVQIEFVEEGDDATKKNLQVFRKFAIGISPFFGGTRYQVEALLRYRINRNSGEISFWFELQRPDKVIEDASKEIIELIRSQSGLPAVFGTPD